MRWCGLRTDSASYLLICGGGAAEKAKNNYNDVGHFVPKFRI